MAAVRAPTLPLLSHITFWALINMESSTTGGIGAWTNPFENYATVKLDHETPRFPGEHENIFELPPPSNPQGPQHQA